MINVTKTFLPPQEEYQAVLKRAWETGWMTNRGVLVKELEVKLKAYLNVSQIIATTNGTLSLQIAIKALGLSGEIITTPFSYVATTSSIVWEGCVPVFVDIHPDYLTIDETKVEAAITKNTTAILATHVYGNPCNVEVIEAIAKKNNLKVIYDGAHCFGVTYKGQSIFNYGDVSTCSFHATKLFHTGEGGAMFTKNKALQEKLFDQHNFGHKGKENFSGIGINAKMSELQAAMGLTILPYMDQIFNSRKRLVEQYNLRLKTTRLKLIKLRDHSISNYGYYPVIFESKNQLLRAIEKLKRNNVFPRRYFHPSLNKLTYVSYIRCEHSETISGRILCLPLYTELTIKQVDFICQCIISEL